MAKKTTKKPSKVQTAAQLHEAARVARRAGKTGEAERLVDAARLAERREAQTA